MASRSNFHTASPAAFQQMLNLEAYLEGCGFEHSLLLLIKLRASQINRCGYCIDMHSKDLRAAGEDEQRLYLLSVWNDTTFYSTRERAALAWTEAVTQLGPQGVPDAVFDQAAAQFTQRELADLSLAVVAINGWNRLCVAFRAPVGSYEPMPAAPPAVHAVLAQPTH